MKNSSKLLHSIKIQITIFLLLIIWQTTGLYSRDVFFIATSDCHYDFPENEDRNDRNRVTLRAINNCTNLIFPKELGGYRLPLPRGVVVLGDLIDNGDRATNNQNHTQIQWTYWEADFGLTGNDGLLMFPVFET